MSALGSRYGFGKNLLGIKVATVPKYVTILCWTTVPISRCASGGVSLYSLVNHSTMSEFAVRRPMSVLLWNSGWLAIETMNSSFTRRGYAQLLLFVYFDGELDIQGSFDTIT